MAKSAKIDFSQPVPLFPLPQCILLPHVTTPLHIFELRYRKMVTDALEGNGLVAMAVFEGHRWKLEYDDSPPIRPGVCVGRIVRHDRVANGRYNILLQGLCRATVGRELPGKAYRRALLEPVDADRPMEIDLGDARQRLDALLGDPLVKQLAAVNAVRRALGAATRTDVLVDVATIALCTDSEQRYRMLCEADPLTRAQWLESHLRRTRRTLKAAASLGDPQTDEGWTLN
jgi:uncharacterized protein